jgi:hypothetical protein
VFAACFVPDLVPEPFGSISLQLLCFDLTLSLGFSFSKRLRETRSANKLCQQHRAAWEEVRAGFAGKAPILSRILQRLWGDRDAYHVEAHVTRNENAARG